MFALAPFLGLRLASLRGKIAMATLIIYFPMRPRSSTASAGPIPAISTSPAPWARAPAALLRIRFPAALPASLGPARRVAVAPIGAVVGEWVGSSRGARLPHAARQGAPALA